MIREPPFFRRFHHLHLRSWFPNHTHLAHSSAGLQVTPKDESRCNAKRRPPNVWGEDVPCNGKGFGSREGFGEPNDRYYEPRKSTLLPQECGTVYKGEDYPLRGGQRTGYSVYQLRVYDACQEKTVAQSPPLYVKWG
jgi:hypothetical protein